MKSMIKIILTNEMLDSILNIEKNKELLNSIEIPASLYSRFIKNTKKENTILNYSHLLSCLE